MRVALAGLGGAALRGHMPALRHLAARGSVELIAICDPNPARLAVAATQLPGVRPFPDVPMLLSNIQPDLLAVATEPGAHLGLIRLGLSHGCDVLCEKPVALDQASYEQLGELRAEHPQRALMPVHQYRYAPGWQRFVRFAHTLQGERFAFEVRIERPGTDPHAHAPWRNDPRSGGGLADHAVHFLALVRDLRQSMTVDSAIRSYDDLGREHVRARVLIGTGTFDLTVNYGADHRRTTVELRSDRRWMRWIDTELEWSNTGHLAQRETVPALSDRHHVDGLYLPLYEDLLAHITAPGWRDDQWREVVHVGRVLVGLGRLADEATELCTGPAS